MLSEFLLVAYKSCVICAVEHFIIDFSVKGFDANKDLIKQKINTD